MLEIRKISKIIGTKTILNDLSFKVPKGKIYGLIGPNGAGKTTTLRIILNILTPTSGEVLFNNQKLSSDFFNLTGYLPEERGLYPKSKVVKILNYLGRLKGLSNKECVNKSHYWLEKLELKQYSNYLLEELSKGNQQKVQFISAILHDPKILILDEPFSGFDPVNQSIFRDIVDELKSDRFIILSTHLMDLAESLCDEICLIDNGEKVIDGSLDNLLSSPEQNIYSVTLAHDFDLNNFPLFKKFDILEKTGSVIKINLNKITPEAFIKSAANEFDIVEFRKINQSLHQLFLTLVKNK